MDQGVKKRNSHKRTIRLFLVRKYEQTGVSEKDAQSITDSIEDMGGQDRGLRALYSNDLFGDENHPRSEIRRDLRLCSEALARAEGMY